ncbi:MAG: RNA-dependent DNA polymerase [Myxococcales bacterium]|nr:RNA-dependent DNA polymerase [Myxococcales bacterium]
MRRVQGLLSWALEWPQLLKAAQRARRGKRNQQGVLRFHTRLGDELARLREDLAAGIWCPSDPYEFHILDPKPRWISAAPYRDRVVHQILCGAFEPLLERRLLSGCVANRRGLGVDAGLRRARRLVQRHPWVLRLDIKKYFGSLDHELLKAQLRRLIKDRQYLDVMDCIIDHGRNPERVQHWFGDDSLFDCLRPHGLPVGNLTSQHFGNLYLMPVDRRIEAAGLPWVRYVDDLLIGGSKADLINLHREIEVELAKLRLRPNLNKTFLCPSSEPIAFLGYLVQRDRPLRANSKRRRRWGKLKAQSGSRAAAGRGLLGRCR